MSVARARELARAVAEEIVRIGKEVADAAEVSYSDLYFVVARIFELEEPEPHGVDGIVIDSRAHKVLIDIGINNVPDRDAFIKLVAKEIAEMNWVPIIESDTLTVYLVWRPSYEELPERAVMQLQDDAVKSARRLSQLAGREVKVDLRFIVPKMYVRIRATPSGSQTTEEPI